MSKTFLNNKWVRLLATFVLLLLVVWRPVIASSSTQGDQANSNGPAAPQDHYKIFAPLLTKQILVGTYLGVDVPVPINTFEPHTAVVNPLNPHNVVVAAGTRLRISGDFGASFPTLVNPVVPPGLPAGYGFCGDDSLTFDSQGRLFWAYLICADFDNDGNRDDLSAVVVQVNPMTGAIVGNAADLTPGNATDDKTWIVADADPTSPFADNLYVIWTRFAGGTQVMFSRSTDQGLNWSAPMAVSAGGEGFVWPSHIAVAPNGDVYVGYHGDTCGAATASMFILRDGTGGADLAAGNPVQKSSFQSAVTCNRQANPGTIPGAIFWTQGALAPYILPDPLQPGHIYVIANDDPNDDFSSGDAGNVILARSMDYGNTWSLKTISHAPNGTLQIFPTGAIDQDGNLMVFWYDNRLGQTNAAGNFLLDVYATVSRDGGMTFSNDFRINDNAFDPDLGAPCRYGPAPNCGSPDPVSTLRIGEYNGAAAANGIGYAAWTGNSAAGQQIFFDVFSILGYYPDRFEPNNTVISGIVTDLGQFETYNQGGLTLHTAMDEDFFKFRAYRTGKLTFDINLTGRVADLDIQVLDKYNPHVPPNTVGDSTLGLDANDEEEISIPVIAGETYYLRVYAEPGQAHPYSTYSLNAINMSIPAPFGLGLAIGSDTGRDDRDNVTFDATPTIHVRVDDLWLEGLPFSPNNATDTLTDDDPGYKVAVYRNGNLAGFATPVGGQPGDLFFTFPDTEPLAEGLNQITSRVFIVDVSDNPDVPGISHMVERGSESETLQVIVDRIPPPPPSIPDLLTSSDSGASDSDNVTSVNPPAFGGTAEANAIIRIFANDELVGEGVVGSDATDGVLGNGLGAWEVTIEPLADGTYTITAKAEDRAGNISMSSGALEPPLVIDTPDGGGMPQRPTLDLLDAFDTGRSNNDNITYLTTLDFRVSAEAGSSVVIKDGNTVIDSFVMPAEAFTVRTLILAEGPHPMSTESTDLAGNTSHQSEELHVTVDTIAPDTPAAPDLLASSDSGGVNIDNITSIHTPTFEGFGEANAIVRIYADGTLVGQGLMTSWGVYQISVFPLDDGVYDMTATFEDEAGNVSEVSAALQVTIARISLTLPGETTGPASGDVAVDLAAGTVTGYPGVPGGVIGVIGIPTVNLDANSFGLNVWGTAWDDNLGYSPSGAQTGAVINFASGQTFNFANVAGDLMIDPLGGSDTVTVNGTSSQDAVMGDISTFSSVQVNDFKVVLLPTDHTETIGIATGQSVDIITLVIFDTVNGHLFVDGGDPSNVSHEQDELHVYDGVGNGRFKNLSGGPNPGEGSLEIEFPRTTGNTTRIDFVEIEKMRTYGQPPN